MKKIYSTILPIVMILCLAMLSSCSGNSDETENGGTDDGILRITADKTAIQADGVEKVTFTVKLGTQDVSEESTMNLIGKGVGRRKSGLWRSCFQHFSAGYVCF